MLRARLAYFGCRHSKYIGTICVWWLLTLSPPVFCQIVEEPTYTKVGDILRADFEPMFSKKVAVLMDEMGREELEQLATHKSAKISVNAAWRLAMIRGSYDDFFKIAEAETNSTIPDWWKKEFTSLLTTKTSDFKIENFASRRGNLWISNKFIGSIEDSRDGLIVGINEQTRIDLNKDLLDYAASITPLDCFTGSSCGDDFACSFFSENGGKFYLIRVCSRTSHVVWANEVWGANSSIGVGGSGEVKSPHWITIDSSGEIVAVFGRLRDELYFEVFSAIDGNRLSRFSNINKLTPWHKE